MSQTHIVKTKKAIFQNVWNLLKFSELRFDDRDYRIGDVLVQREWMKAKKRYTGRSISMTISDITRVCHWIEGVESAWVILHLDPRTRDKLMNHTVKQ